MKRILLASLFLFATTAQAGFLIEPYLGFGISSGEDSDTPKKEYDQTAPFLGARLGYQTFGFMFGLDYTKGMEGSFEEKSSGVTTKADADQSTVGIFVGYNLPVMFRAWGAYYFDTTIEYQSGGDIGDELNGSGYGLGLGFTGLPFVSLNLEYRILTFDEQKNAAGVTSKFISAEEIDYNQIMLSVSLPLDI